MRDTEFVVRLASNGNATLTMRDGGVELSNAQGSVVVSSGEQAKVDGGGAPRKTTVLEARQYYPMVRLIFGRPRSVAAYNQGYLLAALAAYDHRTHPNSNVDKVITPTCCSRFVVSTAVQLGVRNQLRNS